MYLDKSKVTIKGKTYSRCLLRESFRQNGKVKHRTIANSSQCSPEEIAAITLAFEHKHNLEALKPAVALENHYAYPAWLTENQRDIELRLLKYAQSRTMSATTTCGVRDLPLSAAWGGGGAGRAKRRGGPGASPAGAYLRKASCRPPSTVMTCPVVLLRRRLTRRK